MSFSTPRSRRKTRPATTRRATGASAKRPGGERYSLVRKAESLLNNAATPAEYEVARREGECARRRSRQRPARRAAGALTIDRAFLDPNVLFSAAWRADISPALTLWALPNIVLVSSGYAIDEARAKPRLRRQPGSVVPVAPACRKIADEAPAAITLPKKIDLPLKDSPVLRAAIYPARARIC